MPARQVPGIRVWREPQASAITRPIGVLATCRLALGAWSTASVNHRIVAAMITVAGASGVAKLFTMAKEIAIAGQFGTGDQIDAFLIAFALPSFVVGIIASAFQAAVIPTYIQVRDRDGRDAAGQMISSLTLCSCGVLVAAALILALAAPRLIPLLGSGFNPDKLWLTRTLFLLLLPFIVLSGCTALWGAALTAEERFVLVSVAPVATPLLVLLLIWTLGSRAGIYVLPVAMLAGVVVEAVLLVRALRRHGLPLLPHWRGVQPATRGVIAQFITMAFGAFLMSGTTVVDNVMAAMLHDGSVATLNYGNKLTMFILSFCSGALSTAVLPQFSTLVGRGDLPALRHTIRTFIQWILIVSIPITTFLIVFSIPITRLLFERGAFTPETTAVVGRVQALYLLQVPFYLTGILLVRVISAFRANHLLVWGAGVNLSINVGFNYFFMRFMGVSGIALSTALVYVVSCGFLAVMMVRLFRRASLEERAACI